jgi:uncharacterized membrane protein required for colicin V production
MTWIDILGIIVILAYGVGGYFSGVVRRLIGLVALYLAFLAATNMGLQAGGILQQSSGFETPDARIYGFAFIVVAVILIAEGATQLAHAQVQLPAIVLDRTLGVVVGVVTALLLTIIVVYELGAAANPFGGSQLDGLQQKLRDSYNGSHVIVPFVRAIDPPVIDLFQPALPADPQIYFSSSPVNA